MTVSGLDSHEPVIGIDLGTTFSVVAWWDWATNKVEIITNEQGNRTTPSVVSYHKNELLVGETARNKLPINPENTIYNAKRIIGRGFSQIRDEDLRSWPFSVVHAVGDDKPRYCIEFAGEQKLVAPEEISALVLFKMKEVAEHHLGRPVSKAVITVPAYFTEPQKRATRDAGHLAGLDVLGLLTEPTAAALAYGLDQRALSAASREKVAVDGWHILVFDLGGGTFDVSVLRLDGRGSFVVKAITGDFHLGGEDFDARLVEHFLRLFQEDYPDVELTARSVARLRTECERVKRMLSASTDMVLDMELQGIDIAYEISRAEFEGLCAPLFDAVMEEVFAALDLARLRSDDIDDVVLVGGSTRIPHIQNRLRTAFPGKQLWTGINPDEAVAYGAAVQAAALYANAMALAAGASRSVSTDTAAHSAQRQESHHGHQRDVSPAAASAAAAAGPPPPRFAMHHTHQPPPVQHAAAAAAVPPAAVGRFAPKTALPPPGPPSGQPPPPPRPNAPAAGGPPPPPNGAFAKGPPPGGGGAAAAATAALPPPAAAAAQSTPAVRTPSGGPSPFGVSLGSLVLTNVTPLTLGIELSDGTMDCLLPRGTPVPASKRDLYTTATLNQRSVIIKVFEGEHRHAKDNSLLGKFALQVPPAPAGAPKIEVTFEVTAEGMLVVSAADLATKQRTTVQIERTGAMGNDERREMMARRDQAAAAKPKTLSGEGVATGAAGGASASRRRAASTERSASQRVPPAAAPAAPATPATPATPASATHRGPSPSALAAGPPAQQPPRPVATAAAAPGPAPATAPERNLFVSYVASVLAAATAAPARSAEGASADPRLAADVAARCRLLLQWAESAAPGGGHSAPIIDFERKRLALDDIWRPLKKNLAL